MRSLVTPSHELAQWPLTLYIKGESTDSLPQRDAESVEKYICHEDKTGQGLCFILAGTLNKSVSVSKSQLAH